MLRPIQYLGSKSRLLQVITSTIDELDASRGPVLDLFSGSGVVAAHLGRQRPVTAVDVQEYARVLASAQLAPARLARRAVGRLVQEARGLAEKLAGGPLRGVLARERFAARALFDGDAEPLCEIVERGSIVAFELGEGPGGDLGAAMCKASEELDLADPSMTLTRYYGGVYFGYAQAMALDCLLEVVRGIEEERTRTTALAAILGTATDCVTSIGSHFAQPVRPRAKDGRPKLSALATLTRRRERDAFDVFGARLEGYADATAAAYTARAVRSDYRSFLTSHTEDVAAVYADPPYTRDHYSRFYHVLETIARGDNPEISEVTVGATTTLSRGLYRRERHQSPFCIRSEVGDAFRSLFEAVRRFDAPLVLSYSPYSGGTVARPKARLLTIAEVVDLASASFRRVEVRSAGALSHSRFNVVHLHGAVPQDAEVLIVCVP